jgi:RNA polymerase sigma-70 factor (ECF subfamily)
MVLRVRGGEVEAFDLLMAETQGLVLGIALRFLGDAEQAKDACQDAYIRAFRSLGSYRVGESFTAWIARIAANVCCDHLKRRGEVATDPRILEHLPSQDGHQEASVLQEEQRDIVQRALGILTKAERMALCLRDIEGMPTDEVARLLDLRPGTVRSQIAAARRKVMEFCRSTLHRRGERDRPEGDRG